MSDHVATEENMEKIMSATGESPIFFADAFYIVS